VLDEAFDAPPTLEEFRRWKEGVTSGRLRSRDADRERLLAWIDEEMTRRGAVETPNA
jgi:hypothetical protein